MHSAFYRLGLVVLMSAGAVSGTRAGEYYGYDGGYGFAGEAIRGSYIGAPLTHFPRPNELVPSAWGYGTYGVPTVTGIRQAPTAAPTLTVINDNGPVLRRTGSGPSTAIRGADRHWAAAARTNDPGQGNVRVFSVTVPRR